MARSSTRPIQAMLGASLLSTFGNQLTALAVPWFVLETTGSAGRTGLVAAATLFPTVIAMFLGGTIADRMQQKHLSIGADVLSGLTVAAVPLFYLTTGLSFPGLLLLMFLGALFDGPGNAARQAMTPALAREAHVSLETVNSRLGIVTTGTSLLGAPIAGILIAAMGAANVLWINAATFALSALLMLAFVPKAAAPAPSGESFVDDLKEGLRFILNNSTLRAIVAMAVLINFVFSPMFGVIVPYLAKTEYESSTQLGIIMGAVGLGGLIGAIVYGRIGARMAPHRMTAFAVALTSLPIWLFAPIPPVAIACVAGFVIGIGTGIVNPMLMTIVQQGTPAHMLGRALGTLGSMATVAAPLGMLLGGVAVSSLGLAASVAVVATIMTVVTLNVALNPTFRGLDTLSQSLATGAEAA